jgi:formylglycine-generating enzyme required for sulfatase activity
MGSPANELGRYKDEGPQREVSVAGYLMGKYEVTQRIWKAVARYPKVELELNEDPARFKGENLPVEQISWNEVKEFIARLNKRLGLTEEAGYRLPSEAEWEYAARAGTKTPFGFGETIDPRYVNYDGNYLYGRGGKGQYRQRTIEVGRLGVANRFGLYEMHGNVWEWCEDEFHESYNGAPVDGSAWVSSAMATARVVHGGGWYSSAVFCRSAFRDGHTPGVRNDALGFRLSRAVP